MSISVSNLFAQELSRSEQLKASAITQIEAKKYSIPVGPFWVPLHLHRIAALGQLNRKDEAKPEIASLLRGKSDFNDKAPYIMGLILKEEYMVAHMMDGL